MKFKAVHLVLQLRNRLFRLVQQVVRGFRRHVTLIFCPDLIGLSENCFLSGLLGGQFHRGDRSLFCFFVGVFFFCFWICCSREAMRPWRSCVVDSYCCLSCSSCFCKSSACGAVC